MSGIPADSHNMAATPSRQASRQYHPLVVETHAPPPSPERQGATLGPDNRITLGTLAAVLLIGIPLLYTVWDIRQTVRGSWTIEDQREFTRRLEKHNPSLILPDIIEIIRARIAGAP